MERFKSIGIIKNGPSYDEQKLCYFIKTIQDTRQKGKWSRKELIDLFNYMLPEFDHKEAGKFLDGKM
jgi:hypothetical protein